MGLDTIEYEIMASSSLMQKKFSIYNRQVAKYKNIYFQL